MSIEIWQAKPLFYPPPNISDETKAFPEASHVAPLASIGLRCSGPLNHPPLSLRQN